jgi:hypothetical protein
MAKIENIVTLKELSIYDTELKSHIEDKNTELKSYIGSKTGEGENSHVEGRGTVAIGDGAHAEGFGSGPIFGNNSSYDFEPRAIFTCSVNSDIISVPLALGMYLSPGSLVLIKYLINDITHGFKTIVERVANREASYVQVTLADTVPATEGTIQLYGENWCRAGHTEGYLTSAGVMSEFHGLDSTASHAEGFISVADGDGAHAEGYATLATGEGAHAEGMYTTAVAVGSHSGGFRTKAGYPYQNVIGKYNDNKSNTLFEVGNGTNEGYKSNALEVLADGRVKVYGTPTEDEDVIRKKDLSSAEIGDIVIDGDIIGYSNIKIFSDNSEDEPIPAEYTSININADIDTTFKSTGFVLEDSRGGDPWYIGFPNKSGEIAVLTQKTGNSYKSLEVEAIDVQGINISEFGHINFYGYNNITTGNGFVLQDYEQAC